MYIMSERMRIHGGIPLKGEVAVSGGKNASLAIIPATLLASSPCTLENVPDIEDVRVTIEMLRCLGAEVEFENNVLLVDPTTVKHHSVPYEYASLMRASYYLAPVLLGLFKRAEVPLPGGCPIGARPIDQTIKGMTALGADVEIKGGAIHASTKGLRGADVYLDMVSVGATVNTVLTAVNAGGNTTIHNSAKEPHVVDLANFLNSMGARIKGAGTDTIRVAGGRPLRGSTYTVIPDQIETGTLMIAAAATRGDVIISGAIPTHMEALSAKLLEMGVYVGEEDDRIHIRSEGKLRAVNVKTQVYPGFPTDLQQPMAALLSTAKGSSTITETIYESRLLYVEELNRMGANIRLFGRTAVLDGADQLNGAPVTANDLRAGAAMIIAGLMAEGVTDIYGLNCIQRGYDHIDEKLRRLGARVEILGTGR